MIRVSPDLKQDLERYAAKSGTTTSHAVRTMSIWYMKKFDSLVDDISL